MAPFAQAFTNKGIATWNIEYRRTDEVGGGWPGTFSDVANAIDHIKTLAPKYNLDLSRVVIIGHSAGGHLALWAAARHRLPMDSILYTPRPFKPNAVVNIAGPGDLNAFLDLEEAACGCKVIHQLLDFSGTNESNNPKYQQVSPYQMLPLKIPQFLFTGEFDNAAPADLMKAYQSHAIKLGDVVGLDVIKMQATLK